jgi:hypothetical protein
MLFAQAVENGASHIMPVAAVQCGFSAAQQPVSALY